jgi:hypothetical protein
VRGRFESFPLMDELVARLADIVNRGLSNNSTTHMSFYINSLAAGLSRIGCEIHTSYVSLRLSLRSQALFRNTWVFQTQQMFRS